MELVAMDMHVLTELSEKIMPDESLYTYEMPRELSRYLAAGCWSPGCMFWTVAAFQICGIGLIMPHDGNLTLLYLLPDPKCS